MTSWLEKFKLKEMEYSKTRLVDNGKAIILATGIMNGHEFVILNLGPHPCSYIKLPNTSRLIGISYEDIPVECHGGLTFSGKLNTIKIDGYWLGWDYGHSGDYEGYFENDSIIQGDKKWTTDELLNEMWNATYSLKKIRQLINKIMPTEEMYTE